MKMTEEGLFKRGKLRLYRGEYLSAISLPVGGIGTGSIQMDGKGTRPIWQIFGNMTQIPMPDSFFAARIKVSDEKPVLRAIQTIDVGPFKSLKSLTFRGEYPFGWFYYDDPAVPVKIEMETFNPLIPLNVKDSGIPCAIYRLTAESNSDKPVEISFMATQQNAAGYDGISPIHGRFCPNYGANVNQVVREDNTTILHMYAIDPIRESVSIASHLGNMALMTFTKEACSCTDWTNLEALAADIMDDGKLSGEEISKPSSWGKTVNGALVVPFTLEPGEKRAITFVLTWYFPNAWHGIGNWGGPGNMYTNRWTDALDVARYLAKHLPELTKWTRLYHDTFYTSNLPYWLLDGISAQTDIIRTQTCFWTKKGYFGAWEGCRPSKGSCPGNPTHVWEYPQAHARLFPEIARNMRESKLQIQHPNGMIPLRSLEGVDKPYAFDGQCGEICAAYREYLTGSDRKWLDSHWPQIRKAMDFLINQHDKDEDGILTGPQWNLDAYSSGSSTWMGSRYLAALVASARMADIQGDKNSAARYQRIFESGSKKQDNTLFNGEYYIQLPDPQPQQDYFTGCHIDQLLGQWWANQLGLDWLYPREHVRSALASVFKYNFRTNFRGIKQAPRKFVVEKDSGTQMITWPKGGRPETKFCTPYADEAMTGFEYAVAANMIQAGLLKEGFAVVYAARARYDGRLRTGLTTRSASWGYSGNPFSDDECGKFYARAMSIWSILLACQGFIHENPAGIIGFKPVWKPTDHISFFTAAEGWGLFSQKRENNRQIECIDVRWGKLRVKELIFEVPEEVGKVVAKIRCANQDISVMVHHNQTEVQLMLANEVTINQGSTVEAILEFFS